MFSWLRKASRRTHAVLAAKLVVVLELDLVAVELEETEVDGELVGVLGRGDAGVADGPLVPIELGDDAPGVAAGVGGEVVGGVGEEGEAEEALAGIDAEGVLVEEVEDAEVAGDEDEAAAVVVAGEAGGAGVLVLVLAAEVEGLAEVGAGAVEGGELGAALLQLEVLDGAAEALELGERALGDELGDPIDLGALPGAGAEVEGGGAGEALLGGGEQGVDAAVEVGVLGVEGLLPTVDVGELAVGVPTLVLEVVQAALGEVLHEGGLGVGVFVGVLDEAAGTGWTCR